MNAEVEKLVNRAYAVPNSYEGFPEPLIVEFEDEYGWRWDRALCPVKGCTYEGLVHGFNQHYARRHAPEQWRQKAKRVLRVLEVKS